MTVSDSAISSAVSEYLSRHPGEAVQLSEALLRLRQGQNFASRRTFPMHVTVGALLVCRESNILLVEHRAYGITLQPGGHVEPTDTTLIGAAMRELTEEVGLDLAGVVPLSRRPIYIEYGKVPPRPAKDEPEHYHLDIGYSFATAQTAVGAIQESEVTGASWYPLAVAERVVGPRVTRALRAPAQLG